MKCFQWSLRAKKWFALFLLVAQTVGVVFCMNKSRSLSEKNGNRSFALSTAVFLGEVSKILGSLLFVLVTSSFSWVSFREQLRFGYIVQYSECLKVFIPAFLYSLQNNMLFIGASSLNPAVYHTLYQGKIITTALLSIVILHKRLSSTRWVALFMLIVGVIGIQLGSATVESRVAHHDHFFKGIVAVLIACVTSALAGVYLELILKRSIVSIWVRNTQLALYGSCICLAGVYLNDRERVVQDGFFYGYNYLTWCAVLLNGMGGLIIAAVLVYADNLYKCCGNALAIVMTMLFSYLFVEDFVLNLVVVVSGLCIVSAIIQYSLDKSIVQIISDLSSFITKQMIRKFTNKSADQKATEIVKCVSI